MTANRKAWIVTWIFAILPLLGWWTYGLFDMDEGFYGAVVAEMNRRGEWITPFYNGHPWFEKPILLYWLAKPLMLLFGQWIGPRLPSIVATIATYGLVAWFARRRWGEQTARWCVLVTASSLLVVGVGRMMMTDAILNVCLVGAFLTFWESLEGDRRWRLLTAFFLGLSVLAKGPVGLPIFLMAVAWIYWRERDLRPAFRGQWLLGMLLLGATIATWYVPAYLVNGDDFVQKFLIEQNLNRFTGGDSAHTLPFLQGLPIYFLVLIVGVAPWWFYGIKGWLASRGDPLHRYLVAWMLVPFVFFTISKAKLPHYILPCAVPISVLAGAYLGSRPVNDVTPLRALRWPLVFCALVAVVANAALIVYYNIFSGQAQLHQIAGYVRENSGPDELAVAYQMPRRQASQGTGELKIQETEQPSLAMYLDQAVPEPDDLPALLSDARAEWVITREGRITEDGFRYARQQGRELRPEPTPFTQTPYRLYHLAAAPGKRTRR